MSNFIFRKALPCFAALIFLSLILLVAPFRAQSGGADNSSRPFSVSDVRQSGQGDLYRVSSTQRQGNVDYVSIEPGKTATIFDVKGAGIIDWIWMAYLSADPSASRMLVLEMYWDGAASPSVRVPIGDFFGAHFCKRIEFSSDMLAVAPTRGTGFNSYWPMPFSNGAKIIVRNESPLPVMAFYFQVDYRKLTAPPQTPLRFHAEYRQAPPKPFEETMRNYEVASLKGKGVFAGYTIGVGNVAGQWFGEGDEILEIDGRINQGTGLEDAFGLAWNPAKSFAGATMGFLVNSPVGKEWRGFYNMYRYYINPLIYFTNSFKVSFERRSQDAWSSVAYWYQAPPAAVASLPAPKLREPPRSDEGAATVEEIRRLYAQAYRISGWPNNFKSFYSMGDIINRVDLLLQQEDYPAALRLLKAVAQEK